MGAGHAFPEYAAIGRRFKPPSVRKARLAEALVLLRRLLEGEEITFTGDHYRLQNVRIMRALQARVPFLVGVNGRDALAHAARHADTIGLTMLGRTLNDGQRHEVRWQSDRLDRTIDYIREQAGQRWRDLELNALVQRVVVTHDREGAARELVQRVEDALDTPFLAIGTHDEITAHLLQCRERWGISYFSVRELEAFAPVIDRLRKADATT